MSFIETILRRPPRVTMPKGLEFEPLKGQLGNTWDISERRAKSILNESLKGLKTVRPELKPDETDCKVIVTIITNALASASINRLQYLPHRVKIDQAATVERFASLEVLRIIIKAGITNLDVDRYLVAARELATAITNTRIETLNAKDPKAARYIIRSRLPGPFAVLAMRRGRLSSV